MFGYDESDAQADGRLCRTWDICMGVEGLLDCRLDSPSGHPPPEQSPQMRPFCYQLAGTRNLADMMAAVMLAGMSLAGDAPGSLVPGAAVAKACENGSRQLKCDIRGVKAGRLLIAHNAKDRSEDTECHEKKVEEPRVL